MKLSVHNRLILVITLFFTTVFLTSSQEQLSDDEIEQISSSVVRITVERGGDTAPEIGSGVIIREDGYILTALELVNHEDINKITIAQYTQVDKPPEDRFRAKVLFPPPFGLGSYTVYTIDENQVVTEGDTLNLAVLRIETDLNEDIVNRADLGLNYMPFWTDDLTNTDRVYIFAYTESLGGGNITADGGVVATDLGAEREFRSDNIFGKGASGGLIINDFGQMVGIATSVIEVIEGQQAIASLTRFVPIGEICEDSEDVCDLLPDNTPPVRTAKRAVVCIGINDVLNLRDSPSRNGDILHELQFSEHVAIIGRVSTPNDGFSWQELQVLDGNGTQGWAAEIINNTRTLIPYQSEGADQQFYDIEIAKRAIVCVPPRNISVNLRRSPGGFSEKQLLMGSLVDVVSGPVNQDGALWWNVVDSDGDRGWVAEVDNGVAILIGLPN